MSNKAKSRKRKEKAMFDFLIAITKVAVASKVAAQKIRQIKYPKFANGGIVWKNKPIEKPKGSEFDMDVANTLLLPSFVIPKDIDLSKRNVIFRGGEFVLPTKSKGATPYDNDQYMFQDD